MKKICSVLLVLMFLVSVRETQARWRRTKSIPMPKSETELVNRVVYCFQTQDTMGYFNMFPSFDTLWHLVMHNKDNSPKAIEALNELKEHPKELLKFDPAVNPAIINRFCKILKKGGDSGIHWSNVVLQRFELQKMPITRSIIGFDKIASERFMGYVFIRDILGRTTYCFTMSEIQKINGCFMGGQVYDIMEASTIEQYNARVEFERNYLIKLKNDEEDSIKVAFVRDSLRNDSVKRHLLVLPPVDSTKMKDSLKLRNSPPENEEAETKNTRREVVDRKYYEGKFDDEINVELYVRYMKDLNTGVVMFWDALYKFGDQKDYIKLDVTKKDDKWEFEDDPPVGSMELVLKNKVYIGSWSNNENSSGYDVVLKETVITPKKMETLEKIMDMGLAGRTDGPNIDPDNDGKKSKKKGGKKKTTKSDDEGDD